MAWYRSQALFVATTLVAVLALMAALLIPLAEYCEPGHVPKSASGRTRLHEGTGRGRAGVSVHQARQKPAPGAGSVQRGRREKARELVARIWCGTKVTDFLVAIAALWLAVVVGWQSYQLTRVVDSAERVPSNVRACVRYRGSSNT
mgnify:CR=1 FL=1